MRSPTLILGLLLAATALGCAHTHTAGDRGSGTTAEGRPESPAKGEKGNSADRPAHHAGATVTPGTRADAPPLATSPAGLLKPDAVEAIQEKLASRGDLSDKRESGKLDPPTREALREFQRKNNLPATGMPDDLTVQKLGLEPGQIFRATTKNQNEATR
jgi:peptidoglycan hydrolase-like protein with peptidoglycan-binding domain